MPRAPPRYAESAPSVIESEPMKLEEALEIAGWPKSLLAPEKRPDVVTDLRAFEKELLLQSHINRIVVLRDGVRRLGHGNALPSQRMKKERENGKSRTE